VVQIAVLDRVSRGDLPVNLDDFVERFKAALAERWLTDTFDIYR